MPIPFVIDNQQHRMSDALNELIAQSGGKPLDIARTARSALAQEARLYQDLIDRIPYRVTGMTDGKANGLEKRLEAML